ncbi:MAG TPA: SpaA isopeptide-forming pilin-related protein [Actinomycetota bacterium]|nr:SpaA isopeptide-forming pilin-related protein [Actinomycetota bacterium]
MRKVAIAATLAVLASLLSVLAVTPALATHVEPVEFPDNPTCAALPGDDDIIELRVQPVADGTYTDGTLTVTIDVRDTADGPVFDFSSNIGVDSVFVKGGNNGNLYTYDPPAEATADTGLHAPVNPNNDLFFGLSHISFCYDLEANIKVNKTIPNVVTGTESITVTFVAVLGGGDPATDPEGTCSITFTAGQTSGSCTITGLEPNTTYDIYETVTGGFDPQPSQTVTTGAGGSIKEVSFTNTFDNATATALKVTIPDADDAEGWTFNLFLDNAPAGAGAEDTLVASDVTDASGLAELGELVAEGNYYITELNQAGWTSDGGVNCTFTVDYPADAGTVFDDCVFTNTRLAYAEVVKITDPVGQEGGFEFTLFADDDATAGPSAGDTEVAVVTTTDGTAVNFGVDLDEGAYYILETDGPAGFESNGGDAGCVFTVDFPADAGLMFTCTWTNTQQGTITIAKTVSGAASTDTFTFELREGADDNDPLDPTDDSAGTLLDTETITADGLAVQLDGFLSPGTYQVCELLPGPGWMSTLGGAGQFILVINDSNERVCTDVVVGAGQDVAVTADNTPPPGGAQLTIGFWKTHSCQAPGNQENVLGEVLATFSGGGFLTGDVFVDACNEAVSLLDKRAINTGKKMASDPAYNLAAQYVAAKLNVQGGAGTCPDATLAIAQAQALLDAINFNGTGSYKNITPTQQTAANELANTLDQYNNGFLC